VATAMSEARAIVNADDKRGADALAILAIQAPRIRGQLRPRLVRGRPRQSFVHACVTISAFAKELTKRCLRFDDAFGFLLSLQDRRYIDHDGAV